ncbi:MAG: TetR/AcrR family transcriptional regulator [Deltaproteobacteria bacterium]|nr:TetR/AcrR family transcriptional regulator [Deltaproteobacteria bacterium]MBW2419392.1 TetR/AcrR family transcriptional regulator [Deltaproteobacteria bacterium]
MPTRSDPERGSGATREKILDVAEQLIARHGMEGFQLKEVAARVGIRPPSIFAHFSGRDAIAEEVSDRLMERIAEQFDDDHSGRPSEVLCRWIRNVVRYLAENPAHIRLLLRDMGQVGFPQIHECPDSLELFDQIRTEFEALVKRGESEGEFRSVRIPALIAQILGACISNLVWGGWDDEGNPIPGVSVSVIERETQELALGFVLAAGYEADGRADTLAS